jgi:uncharacterized protein
MAKLLLLLGVIAVIIWLLTHQRRSVRHDGSAASAPRPAEKMVACARCGVHLPQSEAVSVAGRYYCCPEHGQQGPRA